MRTFMTTALILLAMAFPLTICGEEGPKSQFQRGLKLQESGKLEEAVDLFHKVLEKNPRHPGALYALGAACFKLDEYEKAQRAMQQLVTFYPADLGARFLLAQIQLVRGKARAAKANFDVILSRRPKDVGALLGKAEAEYALGNRFTALHNLKRASELSPKNEELRILVSQMERSNMRILEAQQREKRQQLVQAFNQAVSEAGRQWTEQWEKTAAQRQQAQRYVGESPVGTNYWGPSISSYTELYPRYPWVVIPRYRFRYRKYYRYKYPATVPLPFKRFK